MDPRLYIYQLRRPRVTNPTFDSKLINNNCFSIYQGGPLIPKQVNNKNQKTKSESFSLPPQLFNEREIIAKSRGLSLLSNYGTNSLKLEDRGRKGEHNQNVKLQNFNNQSTAENRMVKSPLQDKDNHYFSKLLKANTSYAQKQPVARIQQHQIAGGCVYGQYKNKVPLNLWESYAGITKKNQHFSPKMLNHSDEFRSIM